VGQLQQAKPIPNSGNQRILSKQNVPKSTAESKLNADPPGRRLRPMNALRKKLVPHTIAAQWGDASDGKFHEIRECPFNGIMDLPDILRPKPMKTKI
jgi:hypothetical protein